MFPITDIMKGEILVVSTKMPKMETQKETSKLDVNQKDVLILYEMLQTLSADDLRVLFIMYFVNTKMKYKDWIQKDALRGISATQIYQVIKAQPKPASRTEVVENAFDTANQIFKSFLYGKSINNAQIQEILEKTE